MATSRSTLRRRSKTCRTSKTLVLVVSLATVLLLDCRRETEGNLRSISFTTKSTSAPGRPHQISQTISFSLPEGYSVGKATEAMLIDAEGRSFRAKSFSVSRPSSGPETVTVEFDLLDGSKSRIVRIGDLEVDVTHDRVVRRGDRR